MNSQTERTGHFEGGLRSMAPVDRALHQEVLAGCGTHTCNREALAERAEVMEEAHAFGSCIVATIVFTATERLTKGKNEWLPFVAEDTAFPQGHLLRDHLMIFNPTSKTVADFTPAARDGGEGNYHPAVQDAVLADILSEETLKGRVQALLTKTGFDEKHGLTVDKAVELFKQAFAEGQRLAVGPGVAFKYEKLSLQNNA